MDDETVIIYADEYVFINFCLDFACLYVSAITARARARPARLSAAALLGAVYSLLSVYITISALYFSSAVICAVVMCLVAFGYKSARRFASVCFAYAASTALSGGAVTAVYNLLDVGQSSISPFLLVITGLLLMPPALIYLLVCRAKHDMPSVRAVITTGKAVIDVSLLVDSGNIATERKSGLPLILICRKCLHGVPLPIADTVYITTAIGSGILSCFIPDRITVYKGLKPYRIHAAVAISDADNYGGTDGLMPQSLL